MQASPEPMEASFHGDTEPPAPGESWAKQQAINESHFYASHETYSNISNWKFISQLNHYS